MVILREGNASGVEDACMLQVSIHWVCIHVIGKLKDGSLCFRCSYVVFLDGIIRNLYIS